MVSGISPPKLSIICLHIATIERAFVLYRPQGRIISSISATSALAKSSMVLYFSKSSFRDDIHPCVCTLCRKSACYHKLVGLFIVKGAYALGVDLLQPFHYHLCTFFLCHRYCSFVYKCFITLYCTLFCRIRQPKFHIRDEISAGSVRYIGIKMRFVILRAETALVTAQWFVDISRKFYTNYEFIIVILLHISKKSL